MQKEILFLKPVCTHNIWGGTRLREDFGYDEQGNDLGECWGISAHPNGDGVVRNGALAGKKLSEVWEEHRELFGDLAYERFPIMAKIIDARDDLSIQVHPDDAYAKENENGSYGKTECWYVLDCPSDGALVIGHNAKDKEELSDMIHERRWKELIREVPVKKGDFLQINPGTVHAIKGGLLILETQQNSDITYRLYDYDRISDGKPRELHIDKSIDVITAPAVPVSESVISTTDAVQKNVMQNLFSCGYYSVFKLELEGETSFVQEYPFLNITVTEGKGEIDGHEIHKGDHMIVPCGYGEVTIKGTLQIIASTVTK